MVSKIMTYNSDSKDTVKIKKYVVHVSNKLKDTCDPFLENKTGKKLNTMNLTPDLKTILDMNCKVNERTAFVNKIVNRFVRKLEKLDINIKFCFWSAEFIRFAIMDYFLNSRKPKVKKSFLEKNKLNVIKEA